MAFGSVAGAADDGSFLEGYVTAVLERELGVTGAVARVAEGKILIKIEHLDRRKHRDIVRTLSGIEGISQVEITESGRKMEVTDGSQWEKPGQAEESGLIFLPKGRLFDPLIADPRWPHFSATYQFYVDDEELENVGATSFGESLGILRSDGPFGGNWQLDIQAAVFAVFDLDADSYDLVNADYWVAFPISYRIGGFSALARVFHQSSHLGDEFLLRDRAERVNLSYEGVDAILSFEPFSWVRVYAGGGYLYHRVPDDLERRSIEYGIELEGPWTFFRGLFRPVFGAHFQNLEESDWDTDVSLRLGFQLESPRTAGHRVLFLFEYFEGRSPVGQFYDRSVEWYGFGAHFYF